MKAVSCHLILNPKSRVGNAESKFERIFSLIKKAGMEYDYVIADSYEKIRAASLHANAGDHEVIVSVGGDGTINAVINGFFDKSNMTGPDKMLGVIYTGTSPDFCKSYGVPLDLEKAVEAIRLQQVRRVRIGSISLVTCLDPLKTETRYFSCCASIGIGAMVAEKTDRFRKYAGDAPGTLAAIFSSLVKFKPEDMVIKIGKEERVIPKVTGIFVGRSRYIASGLRVKNEMPDNDPRFYVLCVNNLTLTRLPGLLRQLYSGNISKSTVLEFFFTDNISIFSQNITRVEFDGDTAGFAPCCITPAPFPITLITG